MRASHNLRFVLVCSILFTAGALLRYESGWLTLPWLAANPTLPGSSESPVVLPPGLGETVLNFYGALDRGLYRNAYQFSIENEWRETAPDTYQLVGLTPEDEFLEAARAAWGANGADLSIDSMQVVSASDVDSASRSPSVHPELYTLAALAPNTPAVELYQVRVRGSLIERCSSWEWTKTLLVARLDSGEWKILLPGRPGQRVPLLTAWFLDNDSLANLHLTAED